MMTIPAKVDPNRSQVRVLVVDDHEQFHQFVRSALGKTPELKIVGEAFDGLDAVQKAEDLRPDLILLDIGLPELNGLDAARRIRTLCPESRILFLSQESSIQVVETALSLGLRVISSKMMPATICLRLSGLSFKAIGLSVLG